MNVSITQQVKSYFKEHWVAMALAAIPTVLMAIFTIFNIFITFRLDYLQLKSVVNAQSNQITSVIKTNQQILTNETQIKQKQDDQQGVLSIMQSDIGDIHRYFFDGHKN